jgi:UDP-glucose 4-epimerase
MSIGVVGANGFIGAYLAQYLLARKTSPMRLFVRTMVPAWETRSTDVVCGDLLSRVDCDRFAADLKVIYYLAHKNSPVNSDRNWPTDALQNLVPLLNLLESIRALKTKPHIVYFSSGGAIYAPKTSRIAYTEQDPCMPASSYGIQKLAAEHYLRLAASQGYITATALRVGNAYGTPLPEYRLQGLIGVAIHSLLHGKPVRIFGDLSNVRDYVHLEDICTIAQLVAKPREEFAVLNVGSGIGHSVADVLRVLETHHGQPIHIEVKELEGCGLPQWVVLDNSKAKREFGWAPAIDLDSGINEMLVGWQDEIQLGAGTA